MQKLRTLFQLAFLLLLARMVLGLGGGDFEKWCPFGGVESLYLFFFEGTFTCSLGSSNFFFLLAILVLTLLSKRAFCGWICPLGALGEWVGKARDKFLPGRRWSPPAKIDRWLRLLKYPILVVILYFTWTEKELIFRAFDPYYALASKGGEDISYWAYIALGGLLVGAFFMKQPFCRYLCPLAAVLNPFSRAGVLRVVRSESRCISCGKCDQACEMGILVSKEAEVIHARCNLCLECVSACPVKDTLYLALPGPSAGEAAVEKEAAS